MGSVTETSAQMEILHISEPRLTTCLDYETDTMIKHFLAGIFWLMMTAAIAQPNYFESHRFTAANTLRGMLRPERTCYDVTFYDLSLRIDPERQYLSGFVDISFRALADFTVLQIDLYRDMALDSILFEGRSLSFRRIYDAVFVEFPEVKAGATGFFRVYY